MLECGWWHGSKIFEVICLPWLMMKANNMVQSIHIWIWKWRQRPCLTGAVCTFKCGLPWCIPGSFSLTQSICFQWPTTGPFNLTTDKNRVSRFLSGDKHGLTWCIPGSFSLTQLICFRWPNSIHSGQPLFENRQGPCHGSCLSFQTWIDLMHPRLFQPDSGDMFSVVLILIGSVFGFKLGLTWCIPCSFSLTQSICFFEFVIASVSPLSMFYHVYTMLGKSQIDSSQGFN